MICESVRVLFFTTGANVFLNVRTCGRTGVLFVMWVPLQFAASDLLNFVCSSYISFTCIRSVASYIFSMVGAVGLA